MGRQKRAYQSVTIRDVAERAGVAVSTVSRVLNGLDRVSEETRRRVEQAARELSYVPNNFAASMVTGQSKILGIIVPSFTHDFFGFIAQTAEHVFRKHGYLTIVSASGEDPVADPAAFLQRFYHMLDGVLLVPTAARLKDLESFDKPLLLVDRDMPGSSFSSISFDNEPACYELTRRLTEKGAVRTELRDGMHVYFPAVSREDAAARQTRDLLGRVYHGSLSLLVSAMTREEALSKAEIGELYAILDEMEAKQGNA